jgi:hypothetical protein
MHGNSQFQKIVKTKLYKSAKDATINKHSESLNVNKNKAKKHTWQRTDKRNFEVV